MNSIPDYFNRTLSSYQPLYIAAGTALTLLILKKLTESAASRLPNKSLSDWLFAIPAIRREYAKKIESQLIEFQQKTQQK